MADTSRIEGVYEIRIEQGPALRELEKTKRALDTNASARRDLAKETRALIAEDKKLQATIAAEGVLTDENARKLKSLADRRDENNRKITEAEAVGRALSAQYREQINDVSGLTAAGLRFRDKMADASLEALKQSGILEQLGTRNEVLTKDLNELNAAYKSGAKSEEQYRQESERLEAELTQVKSKSAILEAEVQELNDQFKKGLIDQKAYREGLQRIEDGTKETAQATTALTSKFDAFVAGQGKELKSTLSSLALQYVGVGAAVYGAQRIIGSATDTVVEFDQNLANVSALGGDYKARIDELGEAARTIGPKFGVGAAQALQSVEALAKAGVSAADILGGGLEGALTLSASGSLEAGQAAEYAASTMVQFGLSGREVTHIADLLSAAANKAQGEVSDFGNALKFVGPVAAAMDVSLEEAVGTLAAFAQNGILGEQAGTSLRGVMAALTSPSKAATEELMKLGVVTDDGASKLFDAQGKFLGLANLAGVLQDATAGLTQEERANSLGRIFGNQQLTAANILIKEGTEGVEGFTAAVDDQGIASRIAGDKLDSTAGTVKKLTASWENFVLSIENGEGPIAGVINTVLQGFTDILNFLSGDPAEKSVKEFTATVQKEFTKLGGQGQLVAEITDDLVDKYRVVADQAKKIGGTEIDTDLLRARLTMLEEERKATGRTVLQEAALRAAMNTVSEQIDIRRKALEEKTQAQNVANAVSAEGVVIASAEEASLKDLKKTLRELKDARTSTNDNAKEIAAVEARIKAIEGEKTSRTSAARQAKEDAESVAGSVANLEKQISDIRTRQQSATDSLMFSKWQSQIDKLQQSVDRIKTVSATPLIDEVFGADISALPPETVDPGTPLIDEQAAQRTREIQERLQLAQINGVMDYNAERLQLDIDYYATAEMSAAEHAARMQEINRAEFDANLSAAGDFFSQVQAISDFSFDNKIAKIDEENAILQEKLSNASNEQEKARIEGDIKTNEQRKKTLEEEKKRFQFFAVTAALIDTYLGAQKAFTSQFVPGDPSSLFRAIAAATTATAFGLLNVAKIKGFADGGEAGDSGVVTTTWGPRVRRSNGDNVLVRTDAGGYATLATGEIVLNKKQQRNLEAHTGPGVWAHIGVPGFANGGHVTMRGVMRDMAGPGYADGGVIGLIAPRPSPDALVQDQFIAASMAQANRPIYTIVREVRDGLDRNAIITDASRA